MAMPGRRDARDGGHIFTSIGSGSQPTRTTQSWTSNGVHYTVDTTSWASPGLSFGAMTGRANGGLGRSFTTPVRPAVRSGGGGLFGSAFGLLEDMLSLQQQRHAFAQGTRGQNPSDRRRVHVEVESDTDDEDLAYEYDDDRSRSRGMLSRLKEKLLDAKHKSRAKDQSHSREASPARRPRADRRHSSYRMETREPSLSQQRGRPADRFVEVDYDEENDEEEEEDIYPSQRPRRDSPLHTNIVEALENAVEIERRQVRECKRRLEQATRQPAISSYYLQRLLDELKSHEIALTNAQTNLDDVKAKQRSSRAPRPNSYHQSRTSQPQQRQSTRGMNDSFGSFGIGSDPFFAHSAARAQHPDPIFQAFQEMNSFDPFGRSPFGAFDQFFEQMHPGANDAHFRFFTNAGAQPNSNTQQRKRTRFSAPNGGTQFPTASSFTAAPPPPPQPPANLLKPDEAKRLFKTYNERWHALPAHEANIPYPARGLKASSLSARDSIWAPLCNANISTWSEETVMQANAQAFYLGVVGLTPTYKESPGTGRIEIGFDKTQANPAQIKALTDMLKKEKMRWHSDRLGRRNGGTGATPNEALQKDERARAVFHAACELMESAQ